MSVKKRIIELIEFQGITKENFFNEIGVSSANFRGKALDSSLSSDVLAKILTIIPHVNIEWILTGEGEKFKRDPQNTPPEVLNNLNKQQKLYKNLLDVRDQENKILREMLEEYQNAPKRQTSEKAIKHGKNTGKTNPLEKNEDE